MRCLPVVKESNVVVKVLVSFAAAEQHAVLLIDSIFRVANIEKTQLPVF
jgi:hypothetical protein